MDNKFLGRFRSLIINHKSMIINCSICLLIVICWSCNRSGTKTGEQRQRRRAQIAIVSPVNNERHPLGTEITLSTTPRDNAESIDSLRWFVNGRWLQTTKNDDISWNTEGETTGTYRIEAVAHYSSGQRDIVSVNVMLLAPNAPKQFSYRVVQVFPHDTKIGRAHV